MAHHARSAAATTRCIDCRRGPPKTTFKRQALCYRAGATTCSRGLPLSPAGLAARASTRPIAVLQMLAMGDRWDIGAVDQRQSADRRPEHLIYGTTPRGVGSPPGVPRLRGRSWPSATPVSECPCESGLPVVRTSPKCGNLNEPLNKGRMRRRSWRACRALAHAERRWRIPRPIVDDKTRAACRRPPPGIRLQEIAGCAGILTEERRRASQPRAAVAFITIKAVLPAAGLPVPA